MSTRSLTTRCGLARYSLFNSEECLVQESAGFDPGTDLEIGQAFQMRYRGQIVTALEVLLIRLPPKRDLPRTVRRPAHRAFVLARDLSKARS